MQHSGVRIQNQNAFTSNDLSYSDFVLANTSEGFSRIPGYKQRQKSAVRDWTSQLSSFCNFAFFVLPYPFSNWVPESQALIVFSIDVINCEIGC